MNENKNELISKLKEISVLYKKADEVANEMSNFVPKDNYERKVIVPIFPGNYRTEKERQTFKNYVNHEDKNAVKQMSEKYKTTFAPTKPVEPKKTVVIEPDDLKYEEMNKVKKEKGCLLWIMGPFALYACFIAIGGTIFNIGNVFNNIVSWVAAIVLVLLFNKFYLSKVKKAKKQDEALYNEKQMLYQKEVELRTKEYEDALQKYKKELEKYNEDCILHKKACEKFEEEYIVWREIYLKHLEEEKSILEKVKQDTIEELQKINDEKFIPARNKLIEHNNDLVAEEYLPVIDELIELLSSGRADDLKEAINLYEEILYRERELELQREIEIQRRCEENARIREEERRYREEKQRREYQELRRESEEERRIFREKCEHERAMKEEQRQREIQERNEYYRQKEEADRQRRREEKAERDRKHAEELQMQAQCRNCALLSRCHIRRPNCPSYRPK